MSTCYACGKPITEREAFATIILGGESFLLCCPLCLSSVEAGRVQRRLMPDSFVDDRADVFIEYLPALQVGGDYACIRFSPQGKLYVIIGDVSGHGVTSSLLMSRLGAETERLVSEDTELGSVARMLNRWMRSLVGDEGMYVTFFGSVIDFEKRSFTYVNCGHPAQFFRARASGTIESLESGNLPLGLFDDEPLGKIRETCISIAVDDDMMLYTDGMLELADENGRELGDEGLIRIFETFVETPTGETVRKVLTRITSLRGTRPADDVLFVLCHLKSFPRDTGG